MSMIILEGNVVIMVKAPSAKTRLRTITATTTSSNIAQEITKSRPSESATGAWSQRLIIGGAALVITGG